MCDQALDYLAGGWSLNMINSMTSGLPIDVGYSASTQSFPVSEARYLQFRAEAFNLLNKTNFATVSSTNANSSGFGVFNATFPARQIQLALKLVF